MQQSATARTPAHPWSHQRARGSTTWHAWKKDREGQTAIKSSLKLKLMESVLLSTCFLALKSNRAWLIDVDFQVIRDQEARKKSIDQSLILCWDQGRHSHNFSLKECSVERKQYVLLSSFNITHISCLISAWSWTFCPAFDLFTDLCFYAEVKYVYQIICQKANHINNRATAVMEWMVLRCYM